MFNIPSFMGFDKAGFGTPVDPDAAAFFARVTAAGGTLSATEETAVNTLVVQMKSDGTWAPCKAIYPMVGASAAACAQNLKSSSFTGTFSSGWTFSSTGATPNGTSAFFNTTLVPSVDLGSNNNHLSFYSRTQNTSVSGMNMGVRSASLQEFWMSLYYAAVVTKLFNAGTYPANTAISTNTNTLGLQIGSQLSTTSRKLYFNATLLNTNTTSFNFVNPNISMYISAYNEAGSTTQFTPHQCAFASIGDGLTDTQASNLYTAVQAFQTTLSRQV
jgi:hypothetical protein